MSISRVFLLKKSKKYHKMLSFRLGHIFSVVSPYASDSVWIRDCYSYCSSENSVFKPQALFSYMKNFSVNIRRGLGRIGHLVSIMAIVVVLGDLLLGALIGWAPFLLIKLLFWIGNGFADG